MHFSFAILAMLCKETGITILGIVLVFYALRFGKLPETSRLVISGLIVILRVVIFGQPEFQKQDNPASFHEDFLVRYSTFCVISAKSLLSLIFPNCLVYDWQFGSILLVESLSDERLIPVALRGGWVKSRFLKKKFCRYITLCEILPHSLICQYRKKKSEKISCTAFRGEMRFQKISILRPRFLRILTDFFFWILKIRQLKFFFGKTSREEKNRKSQF